MYSLTHSQPTTLTLLHTHSARAHKALDHVENGFRSQSARAIRLALPDESFVGLSAVDFDLFGLFGEEPCDC
jgi:hypothetical protein